MKHILRVAFLLCCAVGLCATSHAQSLSWSSYDINGNLVSAIAGTGGDIANGSVTFTVPANATLIFITGNFSPLDLSLSGSIGQVDYLLTAQGLGAGNGLNGRPLGVGLYSDAGSSGITDDQGFFSLWNAGGPYPETYKHSTGNNLFSGTQQGQGGIYNGALQDNVTYTSRIKLRNSSGNIAFGSGSTVANAGIVWTDNASVTNTAYTNPTTSTYLTFNEFALYLSNTSVSDETLTLDQIDLTPVDVIPEPSSFMLAAMGFLGLVTFSRLRK